MLSLAHIGLAGLFGALWVGWLVVVVRGLYLARHLFTLSRVKHTTKKNHEKLIIRWGVNAYGRSPTVKYPFFYGFPFKRFATFGCGQSSISLWSVPRNVKPFSLFQSPGWITQTHHHLNLINSDHVGFGPDRQTTAAVGILKCVRCEENHDYNRISKVASEIEKRKVVWKSPF